MAVMSGRHVMEIIGASMDVEFTPPLEPAMQPA
jgi:hypothetical protein